MFQINNHQDVYIHVHFIKFGAIYVYVRFMGEILETIGLKYLQKAFNKFLKIIKDQYQRFKLGEIQVSKIQSRGNTSIKDSKWGNSKYQRFKVGELQV